MCLSVESTISVFSILWFRLTGHKFQEIYKLFVSSLEYSNFMLCFLFGSFMFHILGRSIFSDNWFNFFFIFSQLITSALWRSEFNCILLIDLFQIWTLFFITLKNSQTYFKKSSVWTLQDFKSMFGHFSTLYMKGLVKLFSMLLCVATVTVQTTIFFSI